MGNKIRKISRILGTNKLLFPKIIGINKHKFSHIGNIFDKALQKIVKSSFTHALGIVFSLFVP